MGVKGHEKNCELRWPLSRTMGLLFVGGFCLGGGGNVSERSLCPVLQCTGRIAIVTRVQKWTRVTIGAALVHWSTRHQPHPMLAIFFGHETDH